MSDVRNIINVDNKFGCEYDVTLFNQEAANQMFPIIPDHVTVSPGNDKSTGDMWIPWCDSQKDLDAGHYIKVTFSKKAAPDIVNYMFQHGPSVYFTDSSKQFANKLVMSGDSAEGKGEYKLEIKTTGDLPLMALSEY
ncbi:hypothetical protein [Xenorhabdus hominickii]|uniref:Uncharacterized protein n=1 Tax=Xenorhabdus hominickii TaxID=351679 RepID=A0A1V0M4S7_XENHO|nr:hypothetical protein [Xenorhabdus hominickii]ARD69883.1 hypothetical protein [Xenorhabdus hominickii]PHM51597.1 hypothetical protein Xhom_04889 [Xenorhabdus hominickii]